MALPCPGPASISLLDIQNEFGGTSETQIIEYYRGGAYVSDAPKNYNIPTSGQISFDQFFCSNEVIVYITQDTADVVVSTLFGTDWSSSKPKRLIINSGVAVYNTNPYAISNLDGYAMRIYDTFNGTLTIENNGTIEGASGRGGGDSILTGESRTTQSHGGQGGNAIYIGPTTYNGSALSKTVYIDNQGTIYAGGGGGGTGGSSTSATSSSTSYSYASGSLTANVRGRSPVGGDGGIGQGTIFFEGTHYNVSNGSGESATYIGVQATVNVTYRGGNRFKFPKDSVITINATGSGQLTHYFSSNSTINYNMDSSATTGGLSFAGSNNSISLSRTNGSTFSGTLTKDSSQNYSDSSSGGSGSIGTVNNVSGGGSEQTSGQISIIATGVNATITVPAVSGYSGGTGGTWGNSGATGNNSGSPGGASGYAIVNATQYVSYITEGTVSGQTT